MQYQLIFFTNKLTFYNSPSPIYTFRTLWSSYYAMWAGNTKPMPYFISPSTSAYKWSSSNHIFILHRFTNQLKIVQTIHWIHLLIITIKINQYSFCKRRIEWPWYSSLRFKELVHVKVYMILCRADRKLQTYS